MLKLKRLQILGFKSFCDRTELKFHGDGVAAIIGPNGCGKSNISDAISWVLGEQSAKTLRGSRMEDVIFAGTRDRKPTGMAEVSLTLIDPEAYSGPDANARPKSIFRTRCLRLPNPHITDDWDEATFAPAPREATEQAVEEAQPGRTEEVEVPRSKINTIADCLPRGRTYLRAAGAQRHRARKRSVGRDRRPHVVLKIRRRKFNQQQFRAGEIVVTRRLFRSGDSEYLLNGKLCRLRDIQELFMGTGLGPESYALIEQGRIGQILSSRPTDRRAILEEAAGITKFKTKKRLAEARLEDAKLNLSRINDIFDEVTRQMNSLKRQASKAERYARLREEMRAKLRLVLASKFAAIEQESAELDSQLNALAEEMQHRTEAVQQLEAEHAERTQRGYTIEAELRENRDRISQIALEIDRAHARRRHNEERCAELLVRVASSEAELAQARHRLMRWNPSANPIARFSNPPPPTWPRRRANSFSASRKPPPPPRAWPKSSASRKSRASPFSTRFPQRRGCATNWRKPKNAWLEPTAKPAASKPKSPTPISRSKPSADNAANSRSNSKPSPSASAASPKRSANCAA